MKVRQRSTWNLFAMVETGKDWITPDNRKPDISEIWRNETRRIKEYVIIINLRIRIVTVFYCEYSPRARAIPASALSPLPLPLPTYVWSMTPFPNRNNKTVTKTQRFVGRRPVFSYSFSHLHYFGQLHFLSFFRSLDSLIPWILKNETMPSFHVAIFHGTSYAMATESHALKRHRFVGFNYSSTIL